MSKNTENYRKSLYLSTKVLSSRQECTVEKVVNSFDGGVYVRRTYREDKSEIIRTLSEINSPYLPEIVEIFGGDGETVVIEKYIEGDTLTALIADKKLTKGMAKNCARQLLSALSAIQEKEIVHRDIKPENIMLSDGKLTLIDFGIARIYKENETRDTKHLGTEGYAAPEQYGFSQSDKRTDIYSAGKTILKMCEASGLSGIVKKTALRCSQFDPQNRFEDAEAALKYLDKYTKEKRFAIFACGAVLLCLLAYAYSGFKPRQVSIPPVAETKQEDKNQQAVSVKIETEQLQKSKVKESYVKAAKKTDIYPETANGKELAKQEAGQQNTDIEKKAVESRQSQTVEQHRKTENALKDKKPVRIEENNETVLPEKNGETVVNNLPEEHQETYEEIEEVERRSLFAGPGQSMTISYRGKLKNRMSAEIAYNDDLHLRTSAKITENNLKLNIGGQLLTIPFGNYVKFCKTDTSANDAVLKYYDFDGDGTKEILAAVRARHGFCIEQSALWYIKYNGEKFVLYDEPLCSRDTHKYEIMTTMRAILTDFVDCYKFNGETFERIKLY